MANSDPNSTQQNQDKPNKVDLRPLRRLLVFLNILFFASSYWVINNKRTEYYLKERANEKAEWGCGQVISGPILKIPIKRSGNSQPSLALEPTISLTPDSLSINCQLIEYQREVIDKFKAKISIFARFDKVLENDPNIHVNISHDNFRKAQRSSKAYIDIYFSDPRYLFKIDSLTITQKQTSKAPLKVHKSTPGIDTSSVQISRGSAPVNTTGTKVDSSATKKDTTNIKNSPGAINSAPAKSLFANIATPLVQSSYKKNINGISVLIDNWTYKDPDFNMEFYLFFSDTLLFTPLGQKGDISIYNDYCSQCPDYFKPGKRVFNSFNTGYSQSWEGNRSFEKSKAVGLRKSMFNNAISIFVTLFIILNMFFCFKLLLFSYNKEIQKGPEFVTKVRLLPIIYILFFGIILWFNYIPYENFIGTKSQQFYLIQILIAIWFLIPIASYCYFFNKKQTLQNKN